MWILLISTTETVSIHDIPVENFDRRSLYTSAPTDTGITTDPSSKSPIIIEALTV